MLRKLTLTAALALSLPFATGVSASGVETEIEDFAFSFEGPFGSYDTHQLQRGLQVFTEVCSACHGLNRVAYRTLGDEGGPMLPEDQVRAYAAQHTVFDPTLADGAGDDRPATAADYFGTSQFPHAPDLSLMAKARAGFEGPYGTGMNQLFRGMGGAEYIASILAGYHETPACAPADFPGYYNVAFAAGGYPEECKDEEGHHLFPGSWIAMPQPLHGEDVEYADGHSTELDHEAQDVSAFLMWAAEPHLNARKHVGLLAVTFLVLLSALLYATNKRIWAPHKGKH